MSMLGGNRTMKLKNGEVVLVTAENNGIFEGFLLDSRGRVKLMYPSEDDYLPCNPVPMCWSFTRQDLAI